MTTPIQTPHPDEPEGVMEARRVLAEYDAPRCAVPLPPNGYRVHVEMCGLPEGHAGRHRESGRGLPTPGHLRATLTELDRVRAERDKALATLEAAEHVRIAVATLSTALTHPDGPLPAWLRERVDAGQRATTEALRLLVEVAAERDEARRERDEVARILDLLDVPATHDDDTPATLLDRMAHLASIYRHARLLADIAYKHLQSEPPTAVKTGDRMPLAMAWICRHFADQIEAVPEARNYIGFGWADEATGKGYNVTIQRAEGKAPQVIAAEARAERDAALSELTRLRDENGRLKGVAVAAKPLTEAGYPANEHATRVFALRAALSALSPDDSTKEPDHG